MEVLADACEAGEGEVVEALARLREHYAEGWRGVVLREVAGGFTLATDPVAEHAARRLLVAAAHAAAHAGAGRVPGDRRLPAARVAARDRAHPRRRVGVGGRHAARARADRGVRPLAVRGVLYRTGELFQRLFGLNGLDELPDPAAFDPTPEQEGELRERLLRAGEQRATA